MTSITVRMDESVKDQATAVVEELGLDLPTAIRMFAKQIATTRSIPLSLSLVDTDPFYSQVNQEVLRESVRTADEGKLTAHEIIEA